LTFASAWAGAAAAPKGSADWKIEVVAEQPAVNYCSVVCCAPDGRVFLAEDPMDMVGPPNQPIDRILCLHPDGKITVFAEKLYAVFGLLYMDGKLYVHHCPKFSVFDDAGSVGKNRVDLIDCTHPKPWAGMNDHIPSNFRLGMDGWFYMSTGDKGIYGAVGKDGSKAQIHGGGIMRFRPDGTKLEVFSTGTRNHLDVAINAEDEIFTYDNTDDGNGWWTRLTHMVDGGFYGYPYDYKPKRPYTLWMMGDYGGGSPTGGLAYNEDALPKEYHGNLFMCEWGKGQLARFVVERNGGTFKIVRRENLLTKGSKDFRPVGIAVSPDGMSLYIADWNFGGWSNRAVKAGRLIKATYTGKSQAAPKPAWYVPAAMGQPYKATTAELIEGLSHPAQSVRLVAMRRVAERGAETMPALENLLGDTKAPAFARWTALWTLDRVDEGRKSRARIIALFGDSDPSLRRQAARQLGTREAKGDERALVTLLADQDASVRFQAATALGRIGERWTLVPLMAALDDADLFARYAAFTAMNRIGRADPAAWQLLTAGLHHAKPLVREGILYAFRETYDTDAVRALSEFAANQKETAQTRSDVLALLGELSQQRPAWKSEWWGTQPVRSLPPPRSVAWDGTKIALASLRIGLKDPDPLVRQGAARGMIASDSPEMALELVTYLPAEKDAQARKAMLQALSHARTKDDAFIRAANKLAAQLLQDGSMIPETLSFAANLPAITSDLTAAVLKLSSTDLPADQEITLLETLARSKDASVVPVMVAKLQHADAAMRTKAVQLLTSKPGAEVSQAIVQALQDKVPGVRKEAAISLGKRKDRSAVMPLLAALKDRDVRFDAISALAHMPDVRAADVYLEGMASKNKKQRDDCTRAMASLKKDALPAVEARLKRKPALPANVVLQLQKIYKNVPEAKTSPLFGIAAKEIRAEDFAAAAVNENGNAKRGRQIFFDAKGSACARCHRVGKEGGEVGPDLSGIGLKYNRNQLIENVLYPSKQILDGYEVTIIETKAGLTINGILRSESGEELALIDAEGKKHAIRTQDIESRTKSKTSIMPDGLQVSLTISEFADLISYLETLKDKAPANKKESGK
jgi:putative membrane-bound dehydrogenase-like protein